MMKFKSKNKTLQVIQSYLLIQQDDSAIQTKEPRHFQLGTLSRKY